MQLILEPSWASALASELQMDYWSELMAYVAKQYRNESCYPDPEAIFKAFELTPLGQVKVVILGQDPYHGPGQAHGLAFSVPNEIPKPPSLINVVKELMADSESKEGAEISGDLSQWAQQGVLLLNTVLTVQRGMPGSHQNRGWEQFTDAVIRAVNQKEAAVVFMLWGGAAQKKAKLIDPRRHCVLTSGHPSPLSANRGFWFGNNHFKRANAFLRAKKIRPIDWSLPKIER